MDKQKVKNFIIYAAIAAIFALVVIYFGNIIGLIKVAFGIITPLIIGFVMAYVLNLIMVRLEKIYFPKAKKRFFAVTRRPVCITLSILIILGIIAFVMALVIPALSDAITLFIDNAGVAFGRLQAFLVKHEDFMPTITEYISNLDINWSEIGQNVVNILKGGITSVFGSTISFISNFFGVLVNILMGLIFAVYVLSAKEKLKAQFRRIGEHFFPKKMEALTHVYHVANKKFSSFIVGQFTEAIILGVLCALGMLILRLPYPAVVGVIVGFTALIPVMGAYIGGAVGFILVLTVSPIKAVIFVIYLVVLQQIETNLIYPKVVGTSIGLPGLWVFVAVIVGGGLFGIGGMLIGVPLLASVYVLAKEKINKK